MTLNSAFTKSILKYKTNQKNFQFLLFSVLEPSRIWRWTLCGFTQVHEGVAPTDASLDPTGGGKAERPLPSVWASLTECSLPICTNQEEETLRQISFIALTSFLSSAINLEKIWELSGGLNRFENQTLEKSQAFLDFPCFRGSSSHYR